MTTTEENAMDVAGRAALSLIAALAGQGLPLHLVLIALHAEAVVQTAANYGGEVAADMCDRAARRIRDMPCASTLREMDRTATHAGGVA